MDEPDIFHKYFNNNSIIVHSVIKDELEHFRGSNINAVRAMRNINYLKTILMHNYNLLKVKKLIQNLPNYIK